MPAESDYAVGFGVPDTIAGIYGQSSVSQYEAFYPSASAVGIDAHNRPDAPGWSSAATAVHSMRRMEKPVLLFLEAVGHSPLVLDFRHNVYLWNQPLDRLPADPESVVVYTKPVNPGDPAICPLPGPNLDSLLWLIGLNSFGGALAWWLPEMERYHMPRWPNLTELPHTSAQMRMIAMLGNAYLSPTELSAVSASSLGEVQCLLNALSLMGLLETASARPEPVPEVAGVAAAPQRSGLFHRLLERLGSRG
jgi:hypothetical protein